MPKTPVLIVEDDGVVAQDLEITLMKMDIAVSAVPASGEAAIKSVKENTSDLVLMDIELKGAMDGIEAADKIRSQFNIPVVFITAYAGMDVVKRAKIAEPFGYIIKPFEDGEHTKAIVDLPAMQDFS